jgi:mRNA-degrading endonuclease RelE of RelBE toxin-antitoxin system
LENPIYYIEFTEEAKEDLVFLESYQRKMILAGIREQLQHEPCQETRNRKMLRDNPIAFWELRIGQYRIFYDVINELVTVTIIAIGQKKHNVLYIRGKRTEL